MSKTVYLDYAAATPVDPLVLKAMEPYFSSSFYNPSASYSKALEVKAALEAARSRVARQLGAKANEIVFTAGGTEANNLAIAGIMKNFVGSNIIYSAIEHPSVREVAAQYKHKICPVDKSGLVDVAALEKLIDDNTVLISIILVSNEIGVIQPLSDIAKLVSRINQKRLRSGNSLPLYLHSDGCQAANYLDLYVSRLGVDLLTLNGGKIYGPKQSGILFVKSGIKLSPIILGGGQERGLRSGTENVPFSVGFSKALDIAQEMRAGETKRLKDLQDYFIAKITLAFPDAVINGSMKSRVVNNIHLTFPAVDNEWLLIKLDEANVLTAAGSACSAASVEPSTVLKALGLSDELARNSIRLSMGRATTKADLDYCLKVLTQLLEKH